ncbi:MAG TPA: CAP domain-containing protein [Actinomycetota bacterium]
MARPSKRTARLVAALVMTLVLGLLPATAHAVTPHYGPNYAWQLFKATNHSRLSHGVHRVRLDRGASVYAVKHSEAMARRNLLFHSNDPDVYLSGAGRWSRWGENIGWTTGDIAGLQRAFMRSPVHRENILDGRFRHVAIGAVKDGKKLWVTLFFYG